MKVIIAPHPFGRVVQSLRENLGMSRYRLGKNSNKTPDQIRRIEIGEVEPRIGTILRIAEALQVEPWVLFKLMVEAMREDKAKEQAEKEAEEKR